MRYLVFLTLVCLLGSTVQRASAVQCGSQAGGALCPGGLCCSQWGWCGTTQPYCACDTCQSQCTGCTPTPPPPTTPPPPPPPPSPPGSGNISNLITREMFESMLPHRNNAACEGRFYTYDAFITAAQSFPGFATTGDDTIRKREIAAFFGQTSHETTG